MTAELRVKKRLSAAYREQLLILMKDVENHTDHLTSKVQMTRNNLKELEARRQQLSNHNNQVCMVSTITLSCEMRCNPFYHLNYV